MSMLTIKKEQKGNKLTAYITGRVDTVTAPQLDTEISESLGGITELELDCTATEYISSAGLRVLIVLHKTMLSKQGSLKITHVNHAVREVFVATGLSEFLDIE